MRELLRYLNRRRLGQQVLYLEYRYDFDRRWGGKGHPQLHALMEASKDTFKANLRQMGDFVGTVEALNRAGIDGIKIDWHNRFMPVLDGLAIARAVQKAPTTYMEIGSGNSTIYAKVAANSIEHAPRIISIDPHPRRDVDVLCDEVLRQPLEKVDLAILDQLAAGDALFIDGSHRSFTGSDVTVAMLEVLPRLKPGVAIGFHDIFLPFDYPDAWRERGYNEQYLLAAYLLANPQYARLEMCNHWIWS